MSTSGEDSATSGREMNRRALPFIRLAPKAWLRLLDFASLTAFLVLLAGMVWATFSIYGVDFRGYYAAAKVLLGGGNPYDYNQVASVLFEISGRVGNNPYYYPPWFAMALTPLALLPIQGARMAWLIINALLLWAGMRLSLAALEWEVRGWRRWLTYMSLAYLLAWICLRFEQTGILLFFFLSLALWALRRKDYILAGTALALLLTKPPVTLLVFGILLLANWQGGKHKVVICTLGSLAILLIISTLVLPGWFLEPMKPDFGLGLAQELDGPGVIAAKRINSTFLDWSAVLGFEGTPARVAYASLAALCLLLIWQAFQRRDEMNYLASLGSALGLVVTPYALQYDYPILAFALLWIYKTLTQTQGWRRLLSISILGVIFSVPLWERPMSDAYWIPMGVTLLLVVLESEDEKPLEG